MVGVAAGLEAGPTQPLTFVAPICANPVAAPRAVAFRADGPALAPVGGAYELEIRQSVIDLGGGVAVSTKAYNGQFPGPLIRCSEGTPFDVEIRNETDHPELLHWHGFALEPDMDGAIEEGSPVIAPRSSRRMRVNPRPAGLRYYHSHAFAGIDLSRGLYSGLAGPVYIEPRADPGGYDREVFLVLKEFLPSFSHEEMDVAFLEPRTRDRGLFDLDQLAVKAAAAVGRSGGYQLKYEYGTINGRMLGFGEPVRVREGERALFHVVNASATEARGLALPEHLFEVVALDGNPAPTRARVSTLWLGPGERISALVDMRSPGVWVMGDVDDNARAKGMGVVVEYAGSAGRPRWTTPAKARWDYRAFAKPRGVARDPDETIDLLIQANYGARDGFDEFTFNGRAFSMDGMEPRLRLQKGRRYRLRVRNATDDAHPLHLHRDSFEITSVAGQPVAGVIKDVAMIGAFQEMTLDFDAIRAGPSLFHCHTQHHMDFGLMALFDCA
jgi:FtsP/CotA-like multicopper oxidase with cupredoxin domain